MLDLDIEQDECITSDNFHEQVYIDNVDNKDIILNYSWKIIPYDYDAERNDMGYYELIVEGRHINPYSIRNYGNVWDVVKKENGLWYTEMFERDFRHDLTNIIYEELMYYLREYDEYNLRVENYHNISSPWELYDIVQKRLLVKDDLTDLDVDFEFEELFNYAPSERKNIVQKEIDNDKICSNILDVIKDIENMELID